MQGHLGLDVFFSIKTSIESGSALRTGHLPEPCSDLRQYTSLQV
jgi:hypothetical protein